MANVLQDPKLERAVVRAAAVDPQAAILLADLPADVFTTPGLADLLGRVCSAQAAGETVPDLPPEVAAAEPAPDPAGVATALRDMLTKRIVATQGLEVAAAALQSGASAEHVLDVMEGATAKARQGLTAVRAGEVAPLSAGIVGLLADLQVVQRARQTTGKAVVGIETGFPSLDGALNGLGRRRVYTFTGEPGVGKTTFAFSVSLRAAAQGAAVAYLDTENGEASLLLKALCWHAGASPADFERGYGDLSVLAEAARVLRPVLDRVCIIDGRIGGITPDQLLARAAKWRAITRAADMLVVLDYLQKLALPAMDRRLQVSAASAACRKMAATLDVPVFAISSQSRDAYRDGPRDGASAGAAMATLKESGDLEYDADAVLLLTRGEGNTMRLRIAKNRQGESGLIFTLARHGVSGQVTEADTHHEEPPTGGRRRA